MFVKGVDYDHFSNSEGEIEDCDVLNDATNLARLRDGDGATLDGPAE